MKWDEVEALRDTFSALVPYVQQMTAEMQNGIQVTPQPAVGLPAPQLAAQPIAVAAGQPIAQPSLPTAPRPVLQSVSPPAVQQATPPVQPATPRPARQPTSRMAYAAGRYTPY